MKSTVPRRGDILIARFPHSDGITIKVRPVLVIQADSLNTGLAQIIVAMITSQMWRANHPCRVTIFKNSLIYSGTGLLTDSTIAIDNLQTIELKRIDRKIGTFSRMSLVDTALKYTFGI